MSRAARFRGAIFASVIALAIIFSCNMVLAEPLQVTVVSASAGTDARNGRPVLNIRLADESRKAFATLSETHVGHPVELRIDGKSAAKPVMREPITGGVLQITMDSMERARELADRLSRGPTVVEVEATSN
jgi:preprotein translocase subunit SecD